MTDKPLSGKKIAVVVEHKFIPEEIEAYRNIFTDFGAEVEYVSRIYYGDYRLGHPHWKEPVFYGDVDPSGNDPLKPPQKLAFTLNESEKAIALPLLKDISQVNSGEYVAVIMSANYTSVRLRYFDDSDTFTEFEQVQEIPLSEDSDLFEQSVHQLINKWYQGTNDHIPVEELELLLSDDIKMTYPNTPDTLIGKQAFRDWYIDVLGKYFDETHIVESSKIAIKDNTATANVVVRWETRAWETGKANSTYKAYLSNQKFVINKDSSDRVYISEKHALTFNETAPIHGPFKKKNAKKMVRTAPVVKFFEAIMSDKSILKCALCHGLWILTPNPQLLEKRKVICHNVVMSDIVNCGAEIVFNDFKVVVDDDLITGFSAKEAKSLAQTVCTTLLANNHKEKKEIKK